MFSSSSSFSSTDQTTLPNLVSPRHKLPSPSSFFVRPFRNLKPRPSSRRFSPHAATEKRHRVRARSSPAPASLGATAPFGREEAPQFDTTPPREHHSIAEEELTLSDNSMARTVWTDEYAMSNHTHKTLTCKMNFSGFELSSIVAVVLLLLQLSSAAVLPADYASQYGVAAADEMALPEDGSLFAERPSKRAQTFVRFGKRAQTFVRFGKRGQTFVRFGRSAPLDQ